MNTRGVDGCGQPSDLPTKSYIQFILNYLPMIHTMQLFNLIKSSIKNLMNLPNLHCSNHPRQFEEKTPQI